MTTSKIWIIAPEGPGTKKDAAAVEAMFEQHFPDRYRKVTRVQSDMGFVTNDAIHAAVEEIISFRGTRIVWVCAHAQKTEAKEYGIKAEAAEVEVSIRQFWNWMVEAAKNYQGAPVILFFDICHAVPCSQMPLHENLAVFAAVSSDQKADTTVDGGWFTQKCIELLTDPKFDEAERSLEWLSLKLKRATRDEVRGAQTPFIQVGCHGLWGFGGRNDNYSGVTDLSVGPVTSTQPRLPPSTPTAYIDRPLVERLPQGTESEATPTLELKRTMQIDRNQQWAVLTNELNKGTPMLVSVLYGQQGNAFELFARRMASDLTPDQSELLDSLPIDVKYIDAPGINYGRLPTRSVDWVRSAQSALNEGESTTLKAGLEKVTRQRHLVLFLGPLSLKEVRTEGVERALKGFIAGALLSAWKALCNISSTRKLWLILCFEHSWRPVYAAKLVSDWEKFLAETFTQLGVPLVLMDPVQLPDWEKDIKVFLTRHDVGPFFIEEALAEYDRLGEEEISLETYFGILDRMVDGDWP